MPVNFLLKETFSAVFCYIFLLSFSYTHFVSLSVELSSCTLSCFGRDSFALLFEIWTARRGFALLLGCVLKSCTILTLFA